MTKLSAALKTIDCLHSLPDHYTKKRNQRRAASFVHLFTFRKLTYWILFPHRVFVTNCRVINCLTSQLDVMLFPVDCVCSHKTRVRVYYMDLRQNIYGYSPLHVLMVTRLNIRNFLEVTLLSRIFQTKFSLLIYNAAQYRYYRPM